MINVEGGVLLDPSVILMIYLRRPEGAGKSITVRNPI